MKILIIGGNGMLGHQLLMSLSEYHDVKVTLRNKLESYQAYNLFNQYNSFPEIDILNIKNLKRVLKCFQPEVVINAAGIVKQHEFSQMIIPSIKINALFPHRLSLLCKTIHAKLIHISTDCVFSGRKGQYTEKDKSDCDDLYGKTKYLGEVHNSPCLTLRTSIIGLELSRKTSLIEWFISQSETIKGFKKAIYTGFTTQEMGRLIHFILTKHYDLTGLFHVASNGISKYELLTSLQEKLDKTPIPIVRDENFHRDMSLLADLFNQKTGYTPPSWDKMLTELAKQINERNEHKD